MKLFEILCILLLLTGTALAEDLIFFADDHYKSLGSPLLNASVTNPALSPGDSVLQINLANIGKLEELIPINGNGTRDDILGEMKEEMHSADALNINAALAASKPLLVTSGPQHIAAIPAGDAAKLQFNITVMSSANGWYELLLRVDYDRQVDVSVSSGEASPLYQEENQSLRLKVFVSGNNEQLRILEVKSDLYAGGKGTLWAVVRNDGPDALHNCSARLLAASPFHSEGPDIILGDIAPGALATAAFMVRADKNASLQDYQLGCLIRSEERSMVLTLPLPLTGSEKFPMDMVLPIFGGLLVACLAVLLQRRNLRSRRKRRRRE